MKNKLKQFLKHLDIPLRDKGFKKEGLLSKFLLFLPCLVWNLLGWKRLIILTLLIIWGAITIYGIYSFINSYSFRTPIIIQSPIIPRKVDVIISPVGTDSAKLKTIDIGEIADKIFTLESSQGKNDGCRKLGLYNGYGFSQSTFSWKCYESHEQVRQLVINWLIDNISKYGLEQALCLYQSGHTTDTCKYLVSYKTL